MNAVEEWLLRGAIEVLEVLTKVLENPVFRNFSMTFARAAGSYWGLRLLDKILGDDNNEPDEDDNDDRASQTP